MSEFLDDLTEWQRKAADVLLRQAESAEGPGVASFLRGQRRGVLLALDAVLAVRTGGEVSKFKPGDRV